MCDNSSARHTAEAIKKLENFMVVGDFDKETYHYSTPAKTRVRLDFFRYEEYLINPDNAGFHTNSVIVSVIRSEAITTRRVNYKKIFFATRKEFNVEFMSTL